MRGIHKIDSTINIVVIQLMGIKRKSAEVLNNPTLSCLPSNTLTIIESSSLPPSKTDSGHPGLLCNRFHFPVNSRIMTCFTSRSQDVSLPPICTATPGSSAGQWSSFPTVTAVKWLSQLLPKHRPTPSLRSLKLSKYQALWLRK